MKSTDETKDSNQPSKQKRSRKKVKRRIRKKTEVAATTYASDTEEIEPSSEDSVTDEASKDEQSKAMPCELLKNKPEETDPEDGRGAEDETEAAQASAPAANTAMEAARLPGLPLMAATTIAVAAA